MDSGILNIVKPPNMTSFDVVAIVRKLFEEKKVGHTGTLDPLAAGVICVCIGKATKAIEYLIDKDKVYRAEMTLGTTTNTQDSTGEVIEERKVSFQDSDIIQVMQTFYGRSKQVPPMFSAIKMGGKKLYELARQGIIVERAERDIEIFNIKWIKRSGDKVIFDVHCSKGTYIRTLCADIGEKIGCGAHMSFLLRVRAGEFELTKSLTLEELEQMKKEGRIHEALMTTDTIFQSYTKINLNSALQKSFMNGVTFKLTKNDCSEHKKVRIYSSDEKFLGIGKIILEKNEVFCKAEKLFL